MKKNKKNQKSHKFDIGVYYNINGDNYEQILFIYNKSKKFKYL